MLTADSKRRASSPGPLPCFKDASSCLLNSSAKRRKTAPETSLILPILNKEASYDDTIDPVKKLLCLTSQNSDILLSMNEADVTQGYSSTSSYSSICSDNLASPLSETPSITYSAAQHNISYNFSKVYNDNLRSYYSLFKKSQMEIHNDHSLFAVLNKKPRVTPPPSRPKRSRPVPFFKNVNFNPTSNFGSKLEDYIDYKDSGEEGSSDIDDEKSTIISSPLTPLTSNMSFHYRQNDGLNLSLTDVKSTHGLYDSLQFFNPRSIISGQASETIGAAKFMINEFFF